MALASRSTQCNRVSPIISLIEGDTTARDSDYNWVLNPASSTPGLPVSFIGNFIGNSVKFQAFFDKDSVASSRLSQDWQDGDRMMKTKDHFLSLLEPLVQGSCSNSLGGGSRGT